MLLKPLFLKPTKYQATLALSFALTMLLSAILACTANDRLFITLTDTPIPSLTPTPLALDTKFKIGDTAVLINISEMVAVSLPPQAGPFRPGIPGASTCFPNTNVKVLDISKNPSDPSDPLIYYKVQCQGEGWAAEVNLAKYKRGDKPSVSASEGAPLYSVPDASTAPLGDCKENTTVTVLKSTRNQFDDDDPLVYVEVACGVQQGYLLESTLKAGS
ncbi:MAG TPA: hypothetical protein PLD47_15385 [Aggregatilineales bacterium]|nr:hypothetical protein [Anaerolineales bacterium]HRE49110.1 hypothetical protein [Aggregatilineales bacterium]